MTVSAGTYRRAVLRDDGRAPIHELTWAVWPWMNWLLPVLLCLSGLLGGSGGWMALMLLMGSPVFVPAAGLLGSLPRFILRKRGFDATPAPITWLLFLNWWCWVAIIIARPDMGDSSAVPSILQRFGGGEMAAWYANGVFLGAIVTASASWLTVVVLSGLLPLVPRSSWRWWTLTAWITAFAIPALLIAVVPAGVSVSMNHKDAAGETSSQATERDLDAQVTLAEERYERTQEQMSEVRSMIATDGWRAGDTELDDAGCYTTNHDCYSVDVNFSGDGLDAGDPDFDDLAESLRASGWDVRFIRSVVEVRAGARDRRAR